MALALTAFGSLRGPNRQSCRLLIRACRAHPCGAPALRFGVLPWIAALRATVLGSRTEVLIHETPTKKKTPEGDTRPCSAAAAVCNVGLIRALRALTPAGRLRCGVLLWIAALCATVQRSRTKVLIHETPAKKKDP